jgi:transcriptional regulator with XRE-family HTH domain
MSFQKHLAQALDKKGLTIARGAKACKVTYPAFAAVAKGRALPNARTIPKYAKFLGTSAAALASLIQEEKSVPTAKKAKKAAKKAVKAPKAAKKAPKKAAKKKAGKKKAK